MSTVIDNSAIVRTGDVVMIDASGNILRATVGSALLGILLSVADPDGTDAAPDSGFTNQWTVASDNETVGLKYGIVDVSPFSLYSCAADAALGTTTGSNRRGYYADVPTSIFDQIDESTAIATRSTGGQLAIHGVDPNDSVRVIVSINEGYFHSGTGT